MPYVILGILILIVSFVIALVSLVWEQKKVEERTSGEDEEAGLISSVGSSGDLTNEEVRETVAEPAVGTVVPVGDESGYVTTRLQPGSISTIDDEDVWWNKISNKSAGGDNKLPDTDDEKSINAIREELARLTANKIGVQPQEADELEAPKTEPSRIDAKKRNLLAGEFSLGDIKKKD